ncbi:MAG: bifunctional phosphopantothenoylcysteine decarboxylase/phosphopantothenate--cysteine ligase CoaBC, partial [Actinobacteria bacterium]|nr:bifunctional phosphopantothenoylcysteine decarboxylase/phosphopantothenate--cysteine ligase CoaBC [Actinomycetota bacterium]
ICSSLVKSGAEVYVVMSPNATNFVSPITFTSICGKKTAVDLFEEKEKIYHVELGHAIDVALIAPATANTISKVACGICDNLLTTIILSTISPVLFAPAMNESMYLDFVVQENIQRLIASGKYFFVGPRKGRLACGEEGMGRMEEPEVILESLAALLKYRNDLEGVKVLVTAGGTREYIDSVRYISNYSSGKMGYAMAEEAYLRGAKRVVLISTNPILPVPYGVEVYYVESSAQMKEKILECFGDFDITVMAAAVSDIVPAQKYEYKLKKKDDILSRIRFKVNESILDFLVKNKKESQFIVGFSAESGEDINSVKEKFESMGVDMLVANDISRKDIGMGSEFNEVLLMGPGGFIKKIEKDKKRIIARKIWDEISRVLKER